MCVGLQLDSDVTSWNLRRTGHRLSTYQALHICLVCASGMLPFFVLPPPLTPYPGQIWAVVSFTAFFASVCVFVWEATNKGWVARVSKPYQCVVEVSSKSIDTSAE